MEHSFMSEKTMEMIRQSNNDFQNDFEKAKKEGVLGNHEAGFLTNKYGQGVSLTPDNSDEYTSFYTSQGYLVCQKKNPLDILIYFVQNSDELITFLNSDKNYQKKYGSVNPDDINSKLNSITPVKDTFSIKNLIVNKIKSVRDSFNPEFDQEKKQNKLK